MEYFKLYALSCGCQISENEIIVFGGYSEFENPQNLYFTAKIF